jgi:alkaline phosphatase D
VTGLVTVSGDRHSFWAGYSAKQLPPKPFDPVGIAFITGSISAPGLAEALDHGLKGHPLRPIFVAERPDGTQDSTINLTLRHGVKSALEYARSGNIERARKLSNADNAPHLEFVDMGGHGYAVVTATPDHVETEFVCIPRPIVRLSAPDGGPLRYRVAHRAQRWAAGEAPRLTQHILEGDPKLSI